MELLPETVALKEQEEPGRKKQLTSSRGRAKTPSNSLECFPSVWLLGISCLGATTSDMVDNLAQALLPASGGWIQWW